MTLASTPLPSPLLSCTPSILSRERANGLVVRWLLCAGTVLRTMMNDFRRGCVSMHRISFTPPPVRPLYIKSPHDPRIQSRARAMPISLLFFLTRRHQRAKMRRSSNPRPILHESPFAILITQINPARPPRREDVARGGELRSQ
jgi:hypothetical protein